MHPINLLTPELQAELIEFSQSLVRVKSFSGQEEQVVRLIKQKMIDLGYDEVVIDAMGNVVGRMGEGEKAVLFDSHIDTVAVNDADQWDIPPFSGAVVAGRLHGRGSVDMKSGEYGHSHHRFWTRRI